MKIFADWGTSNLRAWLVDERGQVVERYASDLGLRKASKAGFARVFEQVVADLGAQRDTPAIIFGMAGSQKGWREIAYTPAPASAAGIASSAAQISERPNTWIVGGVCCDLQGGAPEVMRGEEVQALGVMQLHSDAKWVCMPGTHSKWVATEAGQIKSFNTFMTGELFDWVVKQSLISTQITADTFNLAGFEQGCTLAREGFAFTQALFQLRTRFLAGRVGPEQVYSMASGFLIGTELISMADRVSGMVHICAGPKLAESYRLALGLNGLKYRVIDPEQAALAGLHILQTQI